MCFLIQFFIKTIEKKPVICKDPFLFDGLSIFYDIKIVRRHSLNIFGKIPLNFFSGYQSKA